MLSQFDTCTWLNTSRPGIWTDFQMADGAGGQHFLAYVLRLLVWGSAVFTNHDRQIDEG
jgi:hypothetical protein